MIEGWKCPTCGIGVSPYVDACPSCEKERVKIASATTATYPRVRIDSWTYESKTLPIRLLKENQ